MDVPALSQTHNGGLPVHDSLEEIRAMLEDQSAVTNLLVQALAPNLTGFFVNQNTC